MTPLPDTRGGVVVPSFVDAHLHLDKAYLWDDPLLHGTSRGAAFAAFRERKARAQPIEVKERMYRALRLASRHGVTAVRAQVDVDDIGGLIALHAALELRAECAAWLTLQVVAFPQEGLLNRPEVMPLLRKALAAGVDAVGGGAAMDPGVAVDEHLRRVFELAREFDVQVDVHADVEIENVARLTGEFGWEGRVTVAHLTGLGALAPDAARELARILTDHDIGVVTVPGAELHTAAAWRTPPVYDVRLALTNVRLLLESGVKLSMATGHVRDPLNPYGNAHPLLDLATMLGAVSLGEPLLAGRPALDLITRNPRATLGLPPVSAADATDVVVLDAAEPEWLPRGFDGVRYVLKAGQVVWPS